MCNTGPVPKVLLLVLIVFLLVITASGLKEYHQRQYVLGLAVARDTQVQKLKQQIFHWEQIASASPTYRDAYIQLAILNYQLDSTQEATLYLQRVLKLDPNWVAPPQLEGLLHLLP